LVDPRQIGHPFVAMRRLGRVLMFAATLGALAPAAASAQRIVQVSFTPAAPRAQFAVWIEDPDGVYLRTLGLTQAVAYRGIGNRPGAYEMNSGFRWPYGRREGVLPVWGHRRASAPGAELFRRVIFQNRVSEGDASRTSEDSTRDDYFCLSFDERTTRQEALDAVSCASVFNSDKGRYITADDVAGNYSEPIVEAPFHFALDLHSLYPPRRDVMMCTTPGCHDRPDLALYDADVHRIMPEIDAVTMATARAGSPVDIMFNAPDEWPPGTYSVYVEVSVEGDANETFPAPAGPSNGDWDSWAIGYGYSYRGQPSVVYRIDVALDAHGAVASTAVPAGYGSTDGRGDAGGTMHPMDEAITMDPDAHPGSGGDRLQMIDGARVTTEVIPPVMCERNTAPGAIGDLVLSPYHERRDAHHFVHLAFLAAADDQRVARYEVRYASTEITDEATFARAQPALAASVESLALEVPTTARAGEPVEVDLGGLTFLTHYWIAVRAIDGCNERGPIAIGEITTPNIQFTTVSPCFVATAAYGSPLADEVGVLRRFRDRYLMSNAIGRGLVAAYYHHGPMLAEAIADDEDRRATARAVLSPVVAVARWLSD
jgi:hypothetical protein